MREGRWTVVVESGGLASAGGEGTPDFPSGTQNCGRGSPGFSSPASAAARITSMRRRPSCRPAPLMRRAGSRRVSRPGLGCGGSIDGAVGVKGREMIARAAGQDNG